MAQERRTRSFTGSVAKVYAAGVFVAAVTGIEGTVNLTQERIKVMGNIRTDEIVPTDLTVQFTVRTFQQLNTTKARQKLFPTGRTTTDIANMPPLTFVILDEVTEKPVYKISGAKPTSLGFNLERNSSPATQNVSFEATDLEEYSTI